MRRSCSRVSLHAIEEAVEASAEAPAPNTSLLRHRFDHIRQTSRIRRAHRLRCSRAISWSGARGRIASSKRGSDPCGRGFLIESFGCSSLSFDRVTPEGERGLTLANVALRIYAIQHGWKANEVTMRSSVSPSTPAASGSAAFGPEMPKKNAWCVCQRESSLRK